MTGTWRTLEEEVVEETVHRDDTVQVRRTALALEGEEGEPALAVERTCSVEGPGPRVPVVLVHGLAQNKYSWRVSGRSLPAYLARRGFEVLNLELRGHGGSRQLGAPNATGVADYVEDLVRVVDACDGPPFLFGHSLGAAVCAGAAVHRPVRGVGLIGGVYGFAEANPTLRFLAGLSLAAAPALTIAPVRMSTGWAGRILNRLYRITDIAGFVMPIAGWAPGSMERELLEERIALGFDWESVEVWLEMSEAAVSGNPIAAVAGFEGVDVPLLVVCGDADPLARVESCRRCYEASSSSDRTLLVLEPFEHAVHWGHIDIVLGRLAPEKVWPRIAAWMEER